MANLYVGAIRRHERVLGLRDNSRHAALRRGTRLGDARPGAGARCARSLRGSRRLRIGRRHHGRVRRRFARERESQRRPREYLQSGRPFPSRGGAQLARGRAPPPGALHGSASTRSCCARCPIAPSRSMLQATSTRSAIRSSPWSAAATRRPRAAIRPSILLAIWRSAGWQSPAGWRRASIPRHTAAPWRRRESRSPCWEAGSMWSIPEAIWTSERGRRAARRPGERISLGNCAAACQFPAAQSNHRGHESGHPGGRGGAPQRFADHRAVGHGQRQGGIRRTRIDP